MFSKRSFRSRGLLGARAVMMSAGWTARVGGLVEWVWRGWGWWSWGSGEGPTPNHHHCFGFTWILGRRNWVRSTAIVRAFGSCTCYRKPTSKSSNQHQVSIVAPCHPRPKGWGCGWDQRSAGNYWKPATLPWSPGIPSVHFGLPRRTAVNFWHVTPNVWSISTPSRSLSLKSTAKHGILAKSGCCKAILAGQPSWAKLPNWDVYVIQQVQVNYPPSICCVATDNISNTSCVPISRSLSGPYWPWPSR